MKRFLTNVPLGTLLRFVINLGSAPTAAPISEAKVSPQLQANAPTIPQESHEEV